jgi:hypothetical protein
MEEINIDDYEIRECSFAERVMWKAVSHSLWPYRYQMPWEEKYEMGRMSLIMQDAKPRTCKLDVQRIEAIAAKYLAKGD